MATFLSRLVPDLRKYLALFLSPVDIMALRKTCKSCRDGFKMPDFKELFKRRLLPIFGPAGTLEQAEDFCHYLKITGAVVSGSFLLDCLYNTDTHSDIDIYDWTDPEKKSWASYGPYDHSLPFARYLYNINFVQEVLDYEGEQPIAIKARNFVHRSLVTKGRFERAKEIRQNRFKLQIIPVPLSREKYKSAPQKLI